jgi:hypothetical protein
MTANPRGVIDVPVTLFTLNNKGDPATFPPIVEFLLRNTAARADFHRTESLNLMLDIRRRLQSAPSRLRQHACTDRAHEHTRQPTPTKAR